MVVKVSGIVVNYSNFFKCWIELVFFFVIVVDIVLFFSYLIFIGVLVFVIEIVYFVLKWVYDIVCVVNLMINLFVKIVVEGVKCENVKLVVKKMFIFKDVFMVCCEKYVICNELLNMERYFYCIVVICGVFFGLVNL